MIPFILQSQIYFNPQSPDKAIWIPTSSDNFSYGSACAVIREKRQALLTNKMIWHKHIPLNGHFAYGGSYETNYLLPNLDLQVLIGVFVAVPLLQNQWSTSSVLETLPK